MTRLAPLLAVLLMSAGLFAQRKPPALQNPELIELDVVVLDKQSQPVGGLTQQDFQIKEDGRAVEVKTFAAVTTAGSTRSDDGRSVALLMDDTGVQIGGTHPMRSIAQIMLWPAQAGDDLSVVRLSSRSDDAFGDHVTALARIEGYQGGVVPFSSRDSGEYALKMVAKMSRTLELIEHRRKVIICIGVRAVCDVEERRRARSARYGPPGLMRSARPRGPTSASTASIPPASASGRSFEASDWSG